MSLPILNTKSCIAFASITFLISACETYDPYQEQVNNVYKSQLAQCAGLPIYQRGECEQAVYTRLNNQYAPNPYQYRPSPSPSYAPSTPPSTSSSTSPSPVPEYTFDTKPPAYTSSSGSKTTSDKKCPPKSQRKPGYICTIK